jgi:hypothetical protein
VISESTSDLTGKNGGRIITASSAHDIEGLSIRGNSQREEGLTLLNTGHRFDHHFVAIPSQQQLFVLSGAQCHSLKSPWPLLENIYKINMKVQQALPSPKLTHTSRHLHFSPRMSSSLSLFSDDYIPTLPSPFDEQDQVHPSSVEVL